MKGWRLRARDRIRQVIAAHPELRGDMRAMLKAVDAAYPFGMRKCASRFIRCRKCGAVVSRCGSHGHNMVKERDGHC